MNETIDDLISEAEDLSWGNPTQMLLGEKAIRLADELNDPEQQFLTRTYFMEYASASGAIDKAIVACAWCSSRPKLLDEAYAYNRWRFLWNYKMILHGAHQLPQISREKIEEILKQMGEFHTKYGYNLRATEFLRFVNLFSMGDFEGAANSYPKFIAIPRDSLADCDACETNARVEYLGLLEKDQDALKVAQPLLSGEKSCAEVPHATFCQLLHPLLRMGQTEKATEYNKTGYTKVRSNRFLLKEASIHIGFDAHQEAFARAISRFERLLPTVLSSNEQVEKFYFFTVAGKLMDRLEEKGRVRKLRLPSTFELYDDSSSYQPGELAVWFNQQVTELGARFDQRNGNDYFSNQLRTRLRFENV